MEFLARVIDTPNYRDILIQDKPPIISVKIEADLSGLEFDTVFVYAYVTGIVAKRVFAYCSCDITKCDSLEYNTKEIIVFERAKYVRLTKPTYAVIRADLVRIDLDNSTDKDYGENIYADRVVFDGRPYLNALLRAHAQKIKLIF